ncbi:MAG: hypothetical protein ACI81V_000447 [Lentimonas sp.]|jgi:hypothetical protein
MLGIHQAGTIIPQHGTGSAGASTQQQKIISFTADATNTPNPVNSRQYNKLAAASVVTPMSVATRDAPASVGRKATQYQATRRQRGGNAAATRRQRGGNAAATRRQRGGNAAAGDKPPSLKIRSQKIRSRKIRSRENPITGKSDHGKIRSRNAGDWGQPPCRPHKSGGSFAFFKTFQVSPLAVYQKKA